jgi:hypothetical protein
MDTGDDPHAEGDAPNCPPGIAGKVGFAFSTKDRVDFTQRSLASLDTCGGFDLVWVDGSGTSEGKALPESAKPRNFRIFEVHKGVKGGPDAAIRFGLRRLLNLGYSYCGLVENDIRFEPGWFPRLMELFEFGAKDGLRVGAATVYSLDSRILIRRPHYAIMWNMGASMVLFTREAARVVLATYKPVSSSGLARFFHRRFGVDLSGVWELMMDQPDRSLGCDWAYAMYLYKNGLSSLGTVPSMAIDLDHDIQRLFRTIYVGGSAKLSTEDEEAYRRFLGVLSDHRLAHRFIGKARFLGDRARSEVHWAGKKYRAVRLVKRVVSSVIMRCRSLVRG